MTGKKSSGGRKGNRRKDAGKKARKLRKIEERSIEILPVIEYAIYEVDKIFESQGDRLTDGYLVSSLKELTRAIKAKSFETVLGELRDDLTEDSDIIHWNIISKISEYMVEKELDYSEKDILNALEELIDTIKLQMSKDDPRAYLSFLSEIMRGVEVERFKKSKNDFDPLIDDYFDDENY